MKAFTNLPLGGSNPPQRTRNTSDRNPASSGEELGHRCMVTNISAPAQTHILKPPVSQSVINRPKQQALSPRLLLPANYEALQVCPPTHTCSQYQTLFLFCNLCSLAIICFLLCEALSQTRTHSHTPKEKHGNVIRSASSCGYDSVHQLCHCPPGVSGRAAGTRGWREVGGKKEVITKHGRLIQKIQ